MKLMAQYTILKYLILELRIDISSFYVAIGICSRDNLEYNFTPIHKGNLNYAIQTSPDLRRYSWF